MNTILEIILISSFLILEGGRWAVTIKLCSWKMKWSIWNIIKMFLFLLLIIYFSLLSCLVFDFWDFLVVLFFLCVIGAFSNVAMRAVCGIGIYKELDKKEKKVRWLSWGIFILLVIGLLLSCWLLNFKEIERRWAEAEPVKVERVGIMSEYGKSFTVKLLVPDIGYIPLKKEAWKRVHRMMEVRYGNYSDYESWVADDGETVCAFKDISDLNLYVRHMDYYGEQRFEIVSVDE